MIMNKKTMKSKQEAITTAKTTVDSFAPNNITKQYKISKSIKSCIYQKGLKKNYICYKFYGDYY